MTMTITTKRLLLRPHADADDLVRGLSNFNVSRWTSRVPHPYGPADAQAFLAGQQDGAFRRAIAMRIEPSHLIGGIGYESTAAGGAPELGYWLAEPYWRNGLGKEAAFATVSHAFDDDGHGHLQARYNLGNEGSRRILLGLGFEPRGVERIFSKANSHDVEVEWLMLSRERFEDAKGARGQ